jgi:hypothetical protein
VFRQKNVILGVQINTPKTRTLTLLNAPLSSLKLFSWEEKLVVPLIATPNVDKQ